MKRNTVGQRLLFLALLLCTALPTVLAQEQEQQWPRLAVGKTIWEAYGLSFDLPEGASVVTDTDTRWQLRTSDMEIDINVVDRTQYTDEELGQIIVSTALEADMDLKVANGIQFDNGPLQGGALVGMLDEKTYAYVLCIEHIHTAYAFCIAIQGMAGRKAKAEALLDSFNLVPPEDMIVRK